MFSAWSCKTVKFGFPKRPLQPPLPPTPHKKVASFHQKNVGSWPSIVQHLQYGDSLLGQKRTPTSRKNSTRVEELNNYRWHSRHILRLVMRFVSLAIKQQFFTAVPWKKQIDKQIRPSLCIRLNKVFTYSCLSVQADAAQTSWSCRLKVRNNTKNVLCEGVWSRSKSQVGRSLDCWQCFNQCKKTLFL